jgi:single-strand DNA-binding protein
MNNLINEMVTTISGWVASTPYKNESKDVVLVQVAFTPTNIDEKRNLKEGKTEWINVNISGEPFQKNVLKSLHRGDAVIVHGTFRTEEKEDIERDDGSIRTVLIIDAQSIGHNLSFGTSKFERYKWKPKNNKNEPKNNITEQQKVKVIRAR